MLYGTSEYFIVRICKHFEYCTFPTVNVVSCVDSFIMIIMMMIMVSHHILRVSSAQHYSA